MVSEVYVRDSQKYFGQGWLVMVIGCVNDWLIIYIDLLFEIYFEGRKFFRYWVNYFKFFFYVGCINKFWIFKGFFV